MMKRVLLSLFLLAAAGNLWAYDCYVGGIYYNLNTSTKKAEVTSGGSLYTGSVSIPSSFSYGGGTYNVTSIGMVAFDGCVSLTSISIPNSVTSIGNAAFRNCSNLKSVTIPGSVKSVGSIVFMGCSGLTSVTISDGVKTFANEVFEDCVNLKSITIPNSVTEIYGNTFTKCYNLSSIVVSSGNTVYDSRNDCNAIIKKSNNELIVGCKNTIFPSNVSSIGEDAFSGRSGLTSISIPSTIKSIGSGAFSYCADLTSVTIPSGVTSIPTFTFYKSTSLSSVVIPNSVRSIEAHAFDGCGSLTSITIPSSVSSIGKEAFEGCTSLTSLTLSNGLVTIGECAFQDCLSLNSIIIPKSVTSIEWKAFLNCSGLSSISVASGNTVYDSRNNCNAIIRTSDNKLIVGCKNTIIPNTVTGIYDYAFHNCKTLTSITIPSSVISINMYAFKGCSGLSSISVASGNTVFDSRNNCNAIIRTSDNKLIVGCKNTVIPNMVTSIDDYAFYGSGLTSIFISNNITSIGKYAFAQCSNLATISVASGNTIYDSRNSCNAIIEKSTNKLIVGCKNTIIPNTITSIGEFAFSDCTGLTSITIPTNVISIGDWAFSNCSGLKSLTCLCSTPPVCRSLSFNNVEKTIPIYIPVGCIASYQAADGWKTFTNFRDGYTLTVKSDGNGTVSGGGKYNYNSSATLKATPNTHYHFLRWNDGNTSATRTVAVTGDKTYTAYFEGNPYNITANNDGNGTVSGTGTFAYGTTTTLTATATAHYHFVQWDDGNTSNPRIVTVTGDKTYTAYFEIDSHALTVNSDGNGTVSGGGKYNYNSSATLMAAPNTHYHFVQWNDGDTSATRTIIVTEDATYTAYFEGNPCKISVNSDGNGTVMGNGTYAYNSYATLVAVPDQGSVFLQWSDGETSNPHVILVEGDMNLTAYFHVASGIHDTEESSLHAYIRDGVLYVENAGGEYRVWSASGELLYMGSDSAIKLPYQGICIVCGAGETIKILCQ